MLLIRNERPEDYRTVEELTKKAFWNVNVPGCNEHYIAHILRSHEDFIKELDLVIEQDGVIVGNVMYTKSALVGENGRKKEILTFGPVSILPAYQRRGLGKQLLEYSFEKARELGYEAIVIFGNPENYIARGFKSGRKYNVAVAKDLYPVALLVKELKEGALSGENWIYRESAAFENFDEAAAEEFDRSFPPMEKAYQPSQELFYIYSHGTVQG